MATMRDVPDRTWNEKTIGSWQGESQGSLKHLFWGKNGPSNDGKMPNSGVGTLIFNNLRWSDPADQCANPSIPKLNHHSAETENRSLKFARHRYRLKSGTKDRKINSSPIASKQTSLNWIRPLYFRTWPKPLTGLKLATAGWNVAWKPWRWTFQRLFCGNTFVA